MTPQDFASFAATLMAAAIGLWLLLRSWRMRRRYGTKFYTAEELERFWAAICPFCGWRGLSRDCAGGMQIADTGDFDNVVCPVCHARGEWVSVEDDNNAAPRRCAP